MSKFIILTTGQYQHRLLFIKSIDFTIASGTATKNILLADIPDAGEIVCAGLVSRGGKDGTLLT